MDRKDLLDTVQRLLALSSSSNEHEAQLAAAKASDLMMRHNIAMAEVTSHSGNDSEEWVTEDVYSSGRASVEEIFVSTLLQKFFFVQPISFRDRKSKITTLRFFGDKSNVEVAKYVYEYLNRTFKELWNLTCIENFYDVKYKRTFYQGVYVGFEEKLNKERESMLRADLKSSNALVLVGNKIKNALVIHHPKLRTIQSAPIAFRNDIYNEGVVAGRNINLRKGLEQQRKNQIGNTKFLPNN